MRYVPLVLIASLALLFEPIRSGLSFANQSCDFAINSDRFWAGLFNMRHIIGNGIIALIAAFTFQKNALLKAAIGTLAFSLLAEFSQTYFTTGHCRLWDVPPNIVGITLAMAVAVFIRARRLDHTNT